MAHSASASDAFHLVIPAIPGYGYSGKPTTTHRNLIHYNKLDKGGHLSFSPLLGTGTVRFSLSAGFGLSFPAPPRGAGSDSA
jgi:hypothetical protein